jgi:hypothetical protein
MTAVVRNCTLFAFAFALPFLSSCGSTTVVTSHTSLAPASDGNAAKVYFLRPDIGYTGVMRMAFTLSLDDKELLTLALGDYALAYLKPYSGPLKVESWAVPTAGTMTKVRQFGHFSFEAGQTYYLAFDPQESGTSFSPILITAREAAGTAGRTTPVGKALQEPVPQFPADRFSRAASGPPSPEKTAKVSFFRDTEASGSACTYRILIDGKTAFTLRSGEHQTLYLAPGPYWFGLEMAPGSGALSLFCPATFTREYGIVADGVEETYRALTAVVGQPPTLLRIATGARKDLDSKP